MEGLFKSMYERGGGKKEKKKELKWGEGSS